MKEFFLDWFYYNPEQLFRKVQRMFWWGWKMRNSYDWDYSYLYETVGFKLERMIKEFRENGHCQWNSSPENREFKRLIEARELANRLRGNYNEDRELTKFFEKYTKPRTKQDLFYKMEIFQDAKEIDEKLYKFMFKKACEKEKVKTDETRKRFYYLLEKYGESWWD